MLYVSPFLNCAEPKIIVNEDKKESFIESLKIATPQKRTKKIVIGNYKGRDHAFLMQNMFPIIPKYIDHIDTVNGKALQVPSETRRQILDKVNRIFKLKTKRNKPNISRCR